MIKTDLNGKILIQSTPGSFSFVRNSYNKHKLRHVLSKREYEDIVNKASRIMGDCLLTKRTNDKLEAPRWVIYTSALSVVLVVTFFFMLYQANQDNDTMFVMAVILVTVAILISIGQSLYFFFRKTREYLTIDQIINSEMKNYFDQVNPNDKIRFSYIPNERVIECRYEESNNRMKLSLDKLDKEDSLGNDSNLDSSRVLHGGHRPMPRLKFDDSESPSCIEQVPEGFETERRMMEY